MNRRQNGRSEIIDAKQENVAYSHDTPGLYIIFKNSYYYADRSSENPAQVESGKMSEKKTGSVFSDIGLKKSQQKLGKPVDTTVKRHKLFLCWLSSGQKSADSIQTKFLLIKNKNFNSIYKASGFLYPDVDYCMIGILMKNTKSKEICFFDEITSLIFTKRENHL